MFNILKKQPPYDLLVKILIIGQSLYFALINILQFNFFKYHDFDLAVHAQTLWNIVHGSIYTSILGIDFLGNHANFILFLIAPVYFIFQHPITLLVLQALALSWAAYPLYRIAKKEIGEKWAMGIVVLYLCYPALSYVNLFEFHPSSFATFFLLCMLYYLKQNHFGKFMAFLILSLLCQENIPLAVIPVGIYAFCIKKSWKWFLVPTGLGILWFIITIKWVIPYFNNNTIHFFTIYEHLGKSLPEIAFYLIAYPFETFKLIFSYKNFVYMRDLFMPALYLPLANLRILLIGPMLLQHLLSLRNSEHTIFYHYTAEMIPFIFYAAIYSLKNFSSKGLIIKHPVVQRIVIIAGVLFCSAHIYHHQAAIGRYISFAKNNVWVRTKDRLIQQIPSSASVITTFEFLPKLSQRANLFSLHHILMGTYTLSKKPYHIDVPIDYALIDFNDPLTMNSSRSSYIPGIAEKNLHKFLYAHNWEIIDNLGSLVLMKNGGNLPFNLSRKVEHLPTIPTMINHVINDDILFLGYTLKAGRHFYDLTLFWKCLQKTNRFYEATFKIIDKKGEVVWSTALPIGYRIYPTYSWQPDEFYEDRFKVLIPEEQLQPGQGILEIFENRYYTFNKQHPLTNVNIPINLKSKND